VLLATVPTGWLLDVSDAAADRPPALARGRDAAAGGMGLPLVARLSAAHSWTMRGDRKHVWARIDAAPEPGPSHGGMAPTNEATPPPGGGSGDGVGARIRGIIGARSAGLGFQPSLRATGPVAELESDVVSVCSLCSPRRSPT